MKSILVLTDFSAVSGYAVDAAILFAKEKGARVFILHSLVNREQLRISLGKEDGARIFDFT